MEREIKEELDRLDREVENDWIEYDKRDENTDWEAIHEARKNIYAEMLMGELGEDIKNVTSGKVKVKLPFKLKMKYWFERLFKMF